MTRKNGNGRKPRKKTAGKTAGKYLPAKVLQPNGSALYAGGVPGNAGGTGRPPSAIRERCRGSFDVRIPILEEIADGEPTERMAIPVAALLRHATCPQCGSALQAKTPIDLLQSITVKASAKAKERIAAIAKLGDIGLDAGRADAEDVRARLAATLRAIRAEVSDEDAERIIARLDPIWRSA